MPIDLQGLLLRFLQEGEILRVGGRQPIKVDVRVVAATNVRLREAIAAGQLREDLYYRLNVLSLHLPALRERDGDVEVLAIYFLRQIAQELGRDLRGFAPAALAAILAYPWPGNVRELIATLRRAVVLANGPLIEFSDLRLDAAPRHAGRRRPEPRASVAAAGCAAKAGQRRRARRDPAGLAGKRLQYDPGGPVARRRPRHPVPHAAAQPDRTDATLSGAAIGAGGQTGPERDTRAITEPTAIAMASAGALCRRRAAAEARIAGRRLGSARRDGCLSGCLIDRHGNCLILQGWRKTLTTHWQTLENKGFLRAIRSAIGWHADCWCRGVCGKSSEESLDGGDRRRDRSQTGTCRHVMASAAGAGKQRGMRDEEGSVSNLRGPRPECRGGFRANTHRQRSSHRRLRPARPAAAGTATPAPAITPPTPTPATPRTRATAPTATPAAPPPQRHHGHAGTAPRTRSNDDDDYADQQWRHRQQEQHRFTANATR